MVKYAQQQEQPQLFFSVSVLCVLFSEGYNQRNTVGLHYLMVGYFVLHQTAEFLDKPRISPTNRLVQCDATCDFSVDSNPRAEFVSLINEGVIGLSLTKS